MDHLRAIHRHLFQDVYPFAGELRQVNMHKADDPGEGFFPYQRLQEGAGNVFGSSQLAAQAGYRIDLAHDHP